MCGKQINDTADFEGEHNVRGGHQKSSFDALWRGKLETRRLFGNIDVPMIQCEHTQQSQNGLQKRLCCEECPVYNIQGYCDNKVLPQIVIQEPWLKVLSVSLNFYSQCGVWHPQWTSLPWWYL